MTTSKPDIKIPDRHLKWAEDGRIDYILDYAFMVPTDEALTWITELAKQHGRRILELGCGSGYWAHLLEMPPYRNVVIPVRKGNDEEFRKQHHTLIMEVDAEQAVKDFPGLLVLAIWPSYNEWLARALRHLESGNIVIVGVSDEEDLTSTYPTVGSPAAFRWLANKADRIGHIDMKWWFGLEERLIAWRIK